MKVPSLLLLLGSVAVHGDILSNFSPFTNRTSQDYDPNEYVPEIPLENSEFAPFSPADSDFGVQQILGTYDGDPPIHTFFNLDINFTTNAPAPTRALEDGSYYTSAVIGANWQPLLGKGWFADIGLAQEFYQFEQNDALDFENFHTHVGLVKTLVDLDDTVFYTRYEYQRLTVSSFTDADYNAQRIRAGLQKALLTRHHQQLSAGINVAYDIDANPEFLERIEYAVDLSYTYWFREDLSATLSWRGAYWDFDNFGREDWNHIAGLELAWKFHRNASLYSHLYYSNNDSNSPLGVNDFESWTTGIGFGLIYNF